MAAPSSAGSVLQKSLCSQQQEEGKVMVTAGGSRTGGGRVEGAENGQNIPLVYVYVYACVPRKEGHTHS